VLKAKQPAARNNVDLTPDSATPSTTTRNEIEQHEPYEEGLMLPRLRLRMVVPYQFATVHVSESFWGSRGQIRSAHLVYADQVLLDL
jgi:hypothetical protein